MPIVIGGIDMLITKRNQKFKVYTNQSLAILAKNKNSVVKSHAIGSLVYFGTKLTQSILDLSGFLDKRYVIWYLII